MDNTERLKSYARSEDTIDLLQHIGWTQTVGPALEAEKRRLQDMMTSAVLGIPIVRDGQPVTSEQLAGMCYGIDFITRLLKSILQRGERALRDLEKQGYKISTNQ